MVSQQLSDDHEAVSEALKQLLTALHNKDVEASHAKLDLFWARLAVHIRAEHLHLFPAVMSRLTEAQPIVEQLRTDHDFFMRELARAIGILRELPEIDETKLIAVGDAIREIEKRLVIHNEIEENQVYRWTSTILTEPEQTDLATRVNAELEIALHDSRRRSGPINTKCLAYRTIGNLSCSPWRRLPF
jgi:hemerythrin superfamily protein